MSSLREQPTFIDERIPTVCTVADVCRILRLSASQFFHLRKQGTFPIAVMPGFDRTLRFRGVDVQRYLDADRPVGHRRRSSGA